MASYDAKAIKGEQLQRLTEKEIYDRLKGSVPEAIAEFLCSQAARINALESALAERNLGDVVADSLDSQTLKAGGVEVKTRQSAKTNPSSSGSAISFVDSITQDENGEITATRKSVRSASTSQTGVVQLTDSHSSTSTSTAATPKNVKEAYDLASGKADPASVVDSATYNSSNHTIIFKHGSTQLFTLDAAAFVKDGMVDSVAISNGNLVITFNTDASKQPISIPLTDIFDPSNYYTKTATDTLLGGKSPTTHTHSVSINGSTKTIAASGGTAVDLGTYKVFNYARVYAAQTYNADTRRYILLAFRSTTYTNNWEESSMFKLVVNDGQLPKELVFRLWLTGNISDNEVPPDPSNPKLYRVYSENFSTSALNILDVRLFVVEKSTASIKFTIGIFIDRNYLQAQYVSYQLYPLSYSTYGRGNTIDNGLSSWTYTVENNSYYENVVHDSVFTTVFAVNDLTVGMNINGNAATATKATQDADGNNIKNSYMKATSGTKALAFGSSTEIGTVGGSAVNVSLPSLPTNSNRLQTFTGFKVSKPLTANWYDGYGASLLSFYGGSGHIYHIGFRLVGQTETATATASNPLLPGSRIYITVDGVADVYVQNIEVYYKVVDNNVEVMVLTPLKSDGTQRINLMGVITRDYNLTTSNSTIITTLTPSIDGWTRKTTDIVFNRMQTLLPTSGSGSNLKYDINISGTAAAADTAAEAGYATAFNIASATTGNVVDTALYKIPVLDDNAAGRWTGKPSTSTGTQQRLLYNPSNNTINANISGDAQSVRGYYITKTLVNDSNAIIFF